MCAPDRKWWREREEWGAGRAVWLSWPTGWLAGWLQTGWLFREKLALKGSYRAVGGGGGEETERKRKNCKGKNGPVCL